MLASLLFFLYWVTYTPPMPLWINELIETAKTKQGIERLYYVNDEVNKRVMYITDLEERGVIDHWASPADTATRRRGDCEDYAILKMYVFSRISKTISTSVEIVRPSDNKNTRILHAVLKVVENNEEFVLDNHFHYPIQYNTYMSFNDKLDNISSTTLIGK